MLDKVGRTLAGFLSRERHVHGATPPTSPDRLLSSLEPADVLLVEGNSQISTAIKYLTQSTWSHAALYVGVHGNGRLARSTHCFVEADLIAGVRSVGVEAFTGMPTRICRPVGLNEEECRAVADFAIARLGHHYDLKNVIDLARYLLPTPPVPTRFRRRMIAFGSGDPTRAICSTLIAQAFQAVHYPVLPTVEYRAAATEQCPDCVDEIMHIRHHSLFAPRDFDVSPYFRIVKPTIEGKFDFRTLKWA
ncbi:lipo-like protein [Bradyrhizobium centrolobii]|uniref:Lipo-like protein n=2 Tax=Bradyrhizobium centrolobii TaxID=1505087 RepID=A0A176YXI4_9BRAD|nr:lipo-like protein [Bradyrhizobium centrolobii]